MIMAKKVFLGVGHGGTDSGAAANGFKEKDLNLAIALACRDELVRHGVNVKMSREKDENDDLNEEVKECNAYAPDLAVDIHNNAGGGDGGEAFYHYGGGVGKTLAQNIVDEIVKIGQNSRGIKTRKGADGRDYYGFIRMTKAPAVIVECAFVDNKKDMEIIDTAAEQKTMGVAIAKGILKTLGIAYKAETKAEDTKDKEVAALKNTIDALKKEVNSLELTVRELNTKINNAKKALQ
jgi:N-acetylmuramoyl-L-alanine amidase